MFDVRSRVIGTTNDLFSEAPFPLDTSGRYAGDPGLFGPDSVTWRILGDASVFVAGIRALLVQAAHPEVVAGLMQHSRFQEDPLGRLARTSAYVTATAFGAMPEVEQAVATVARAHRPVSGESHRGRRYSASAAPLAAWVHNALSESFLVCYREFGAETLSPEEADRYVAEQARLGAMLRAAPLPTTSTRLSQWIDGLPSLGASPGMEEAVAFLRSPPAAWPVRLVYRVLFEAAVATLPPRVRTILGFRTRPGALRIGRVAVRVLRSMLGASPAWRAALDRAGAPAPAGYTFHQSVPLTGSS
ncbi:MAG: oxygenase MpaB family protein [Chloroflexi bacterium]|nr:oxygenase MpaB family protein [Chloroflexota bacterium]MDA1148253.1 oxygenase MpaB family protein [Chloroflexota bacterium]